MANYTLVFKSNHGQSVIVRALVEGMLASSPTNVVTYIDTYGKTPADIDDEIALITDPQDFLLYVAVSVGSTDDITTAQYNTLVATLTDPLDVETFTTTDRADGVDMAYQAWQELVPDKNPPLTIVYMADLLANLTPAEEAMGFALESAIRAKYNDLTDNDTQHDLFSIIDKGFLQTGTNTVTMGNMSFPIIDYDIMNRIIEEGYVGTGNNTGACIFQVFESDGSTPLAGATISIDLQSGTTDADGFAVIDDLHVGILYYVVSKTGYSNKEGYAQITNSDPTDFQSVTMADAAVLTVTVTDDAAATVSGATVRVGTQTGTTNGSGVATFNLPFDSDCIVNANKTGYIDGVGTVDIDHTTETLTVVITRASELTVTVTDDASAAVENAVVTVGDVQVNTDASGEAVFTVPYGECGIAVEKANYISASDVATINGATEAVAITLKRACELTIVARDEDMVVIENVTVTIGDIQVNSDVSGHAVFTVPYGECAVTAAKTGYISNFAILTIAAATDTQPVTLSTASVLTVTVLQLSDDAPIENAEVSVNNITSLTSAAGTVDITVPYNETVNYKLTPVVAAKTGYITNYGSLDVNGATEALTIKLAV